MLLYFIGRENIFLKKNGEKEKAVRAKGYCSKKVDEDRRSFSSEITGKIAKIYTTQTSAHWFLHLSFPSSLIINKLAVNFALLTARI